MDTNKAFKIFIRHQLEAMQQDGKINLTAEELEAFANRIENDYMFYKEFSEFMRYFIRKFGDQYGLI